MSSLIASQCVFLCCFLGVFRKKQFSKKGVSTKKVAKCVSHKVKIFMSILTLSIDADLERFINSQVQNKEAENKSAVVRNALRFFREDFELRELMLARKEVSEGEVFKGDLRKLVEEI